MRPFTDILRDYRNGVLVRQLTERMAKLQAAVEETGKPGELNLKIKLKPEPGEDGAVKVSAAITQKIPERDLPDALFFSDGNGSLLREPPKGGKLFEEADIESDDPKLRLAK